MPASLFGNCDVQMIDDRHVKIHSTHHTVIHILQQMSIRKMKVYWRDVPIKLYVRPDKLGDLSAVKEVLEKKEYEKHGVNLNDVHYWLDAGAHIGTFAIKAALAGARVEAFEPHPDNLMLLKRNIDANGLQRRVRIHKAALTSGNRSGEVTLNSAPRSTMFHSIVEGAYPRGHDKFEVRAINIERFLKDHPDIDGIKIDVQGAEKPLLEGLCARSKLLSQLKIIVFEWDFAHNKETADLKTIVRCLQHAGFKVHVRRDVFKRKYWAFWPSGVIVHAIRA
jgi:FkbM family methyltransferase